MQMKHFEPQYNERGDSPVDLSGREGYDVHDSETFKCEMCVWADKQEQEAIASDIDAVLQTLSNPSFEYEWSVAPHEMKRTTEKDCAEFLWLRGRQAGKDEGLQAENANLKQMSLMMKGRLEQ